MTGEVAEVSSNQGIEIFVEFVAFLSISLGLLNILPIPALDGGGKESVSLPEKRVSPMWLASR